MHAAFIKTHTPTQLHNSLVGGCLLSPAFPPDSPDSVRLQRCVSRWQQCRNTHFVLRADVMSEAGELHQGLPAHVLPGSIDGSELRGLWALGHGWRRASRLATCGVFVYDAISAFAGNRPIVDSELSL